MEWQEQDTSNCSIGRALDIVGRPWTLLILRELFRDVCRFDQIQQHLAVSEAVLSRRLRELVEAGVVERRPYREPGRRTRFSYHLSARGRDLFPVFAALKTWGDTYLIDPEGPATVHTHGDCGRQVHLELRCARGHRVEDSREIEAHEGPGARALSIIQGAR
jgi:DNA-binding HxlR family transcriptional regulator